ncbi:Adenosine kinase [Dictyocoela muelleri]|nr:Adenosine kinase [Dictyocoela muelleri]
MILFICRPMVDYYLTNPSKTVKKHGLKQNVYKKLSMKEFMIFSKYPFFKKCVGGTSVNTAMYLRKNSDINCTFIGAVGNDEDADFVENELKKSGVFTYFQKVENLDLLEIENKKYGDLKNKFTVYKYFKNESKTEKN